MSTPQSCCLVLVEEFSQPPKHGWDAPEVTQAVYSGKD